MQKGKQFLALAVVIFAVFLLTGCFEGTFHVTVHDDGSADVEYRLTISQELLSLLEEENPVAELKQILTEQGFTLTDVDENGTVGLIATRHLDKLETVPAFGNVAVKPVDDTTSFRMQKGLLATVYTMNSEVDLTPVTEGIDPTDPYQRVFINQMKFDFVLTLPVKAEKHNAASVSADGQTFTWNLIPGEKTPIRIEARAANTTTMLLIGSGTILILLILIPLAVRSRKPKTTVPVQE